MIHTVLCIVSMLVYYICIDYKHCFVDYIMHCVVCICVYMARGANKTNIPKCEQLLILNTGGLLCSFTAIYLYMLFQNKRSMEFWMTQFQGFYMSFHSRFVVLGFLRGRFCDVTVHPQYDMMDVNTLPAVKLFATFHK